MLLENQVVSLELAKKLKELGVEQASLFYWNITPDRGDGLSNTALLNQRLAKYTYSAFTVAELGEMLPKDFHLSMFRTISDGWGVTLDNIEQPALNTPEAKETLAKANELLKQVIETLTK